MAISPGTRTAKATQRIGAAMLLLAFLLPLLACVLSATPTDEAALPACCRTHGKHQCMASDDLTHGTHIGAIRARCPFCPGTLPSFTHQTLALTSTSYAFAVSTTQTNLSPRTSQHAHTRERDTTQPRGPPASLLS